MKPAIEVIDVSKRYEISHQTEVKASYDTLKDDFAKLIKKPFGGTSEESHETFWALKDISFEVNPGETFGIIGKNGSGKSTLLKILSRIVDPTAGEIKLRGRVASLLEVGTGFHPELTGRENIFFNGSMLGMSRQEIRRKFNDIVDFSEIEKFLDTPVKFYSSGMYVRLAFAVAAHLEPEILILDEVLSVGDAHFQKKSMAKMLSIAKGGCTILFVSHSMTAVEQLCERAVLLRKGKVQFVGKTVDVTEQYLMGDLSPAEREAFIRAEAEAKKNSESSLSKFMSKDGLQAPPVAESATEKPIVIKGSDKQSKKLAVTDLVEYEDLKFSKFTINGQSISEPLKFSSGKPLKIAFEYHSQTPVYINIGYGFRRKSDKTLAVFTHADLENFVYKTRKSGAISVKVDSPRLAPDTYTLEFHLWINSELVITEYELCEFVIQKVKAFASQQELTAFPAAVLVDSEWSARN